MSVLVVMDVDSTLIQQEVIELLAHQAGVGEEVEAITESAMAGELDFEQSLRRRVSLLAGLSVDVLDEVSKRIEVTPGAKELIAYVHEVGGRIGAVSGGFSQVLDPIAEFLGLDYWSGNVLEIEDSKLTGRLVGEIIDAKAKATALEEWSIDFGVPNEQTVAIGDGANDILMLQAASFAVAFRPKPVLRPYADLIVEENSLLSVIESLKLRAS